MKLLQYFIFDSKKYSHYKFNSAKLDDLIKEFPTAMRNCYVEDSAIQRATTTSVDSKTVIKTYIPTKPHIKSGEFGEILSFYMLLEKYLPIKLTGVKKWFLKPDKNKAAFYTDVVLYSCGDTPSPQDLLVSAEVKAKVVRKNNNRIQDAVVGAEEDFVSRLADTLVVLRDKSLQKGDAKTVKEVERFIESVEDNNGTYQKHIKAVLLIDSNLCDDEMKKEVVRKEKIDNFEIIVLCIEKLREVYGAIYQEIPNSYIEITV